MTLPVGLCRRRAVLATCPRCHAPVLAGHDDDGLATHADPTPLTRTGELLLHLEGRAAYAVDGGQLVRRDQWRIRTPHPHVVPAHDCHNPTPTTHHAPHRPAGVAFIPDDAPPPF